MTLLGNHPTKAGRSCFLGTVTEARSRERKQDHRWLLLARHTENIPSRERSQGIGSVTATVTGPPLVTVLRQTLHPTCRQMEEAQRKNGL